MSAVRLRRTPGFGIAATLLARRIVPLNAHRWARFGSLAAMLAASLCLIAAPEFPSAAVPLAAAGALLGAFGFCAILLMFNEAIVPLSLIRIALFTAASRFIAVPLTYLCQGLSRRRASPSCSCSCRCCRRGLPRSARSGPCPSGRRAARAYPKFSYPREAARRCCASTPSPTGCELSPAAGGRRGALVAVDRASSWAGSSSSCTSSPTASR